MMKLLRKYNKHLLVVFMALLMVVFLAADPLHQLLNPKPEREPFATMYGNKISQMDMDATLAEIRVLGMLRTGWQAPWERAGAYLERDLLDEYEWYMLVQDARRQRIEVPESAVDEFMAKRAADIGDVRDHLGISLELVRAAISDQLRVTIAAMQAASGVHVTEPDVRTILKQTQEKIRIRYVDIPDQPFVDTTAPITDDEIRANFEEYKNRSPLEPMPGGRPGIGYRLEKAVQIEYVVANVADVARLIKIDDDDAFKYWDEHRTEFRRRTPPATTSSPTTTQAAATQTAATQAAATQASADDPPVAATQPLSAPATASTKPASEFYETYDEAKADVIARLQQEKAPGEVRKLMSGFQKFIDRPWQDQPAGPDGYRRMPEGVREDNYLSQQVDAYGSRPYGEALRYMRTPWRTQSELARFPGLGSARGAAERGSLPLSTAAFMVQGLVMPHPAPDALNSQFFVALYQPYPQPLFDGLGNGYVFRVVATRPEGPPDTIEQVRDEVIANIRREKAKQFADEAARALADRAKEIGLEAAVKENEALRTKLGERWSTVRTPVPFARMREAERGYQIALEPSAVEGIGQIPGFVRECFRLAEAKTTTQPYRVLVYDRPEAGRRFVAEYVETLPIYAETYRDQLLALRLSMQARQQFLASYFDAESIRKRVDWKLLEPAAEKKKDEKKGTGDGKPNA